MRYDHRILRNLLGPASLLTLLVFPSCSIQRTSKANEASVIPTEPATSAAAAQASKPAGCYPADCLDLAVRELKQGDGKAAGVILKGMIESYPSTVWAARASFLLGIESVESNGDDAGVLLRGAGELVGLQDYMLFYLARYDYLKGRYSEAVSTYDSLLTLFPDSALKSKAAYNRALSVMAEGLFDKARADFFEFTSLFPKDPRVPDALLNIASCSLELNKPGDAIRPIREVQTSYPTHPDAKAAAILLSRIRAKNIPVPELAPKERYRKGLKLFEAARYKDAINEFSAIQGGEYGEKAAIKLAVSEIRTRNYDRAENTLRNHIKRRPLNEPEALYWLMLTAVRQGKEEGILDIEKRFERKHPKSELRAKALLTAGRFYEGRSSRNNALYYYRQVIDGFKDTSSAADALWSTGWLAYRAGKYDEAYRLLSSYQDVRANGNDLLKFMYWSARSSEAMGKQAEAAVIYDRLCNSSRESYYCWMAESRSPARAGSGRPAAFSEPPDPGVYADETMLREFNADEKEDPEPAAAASPEDAGKLQDDRHYAAAKELLLMGFNSKASVELELLSKRHSNEAGALFDIAGLLNDAWDFYSAQQVYQMYLSKTGAKESMGSEKLAFPMQVIYLVKQEPQYADPYLVAAVMREESAFNPDAVSSVGALGLMQIMPSVGKTIGKELGYGNVEPRELMSPDINIRFGSWYLDSLAKKFNDDLILTIASYNAGPAAVSKWAETYSITEPDEFIESIPYPETRNYAKRVLKNYLEFLQVAGVKPKEGPLKFPRTKVSLDSNSTPPSNDRERMSARPLPEAYPLNNFPGTLYKMIF